MAIQKARAFFALYLEEGIGTATATLELCDGHVAPVQAWKEGIGPVPEWEDSTKPSYVGDNAKPRFRVSILLGSQHVTSSPTYTWEYRQGGAIVWSGTASDAQNRFLVNAGTSNDAFLTINKNLVTEYNQKPGVVRVNITGLEVDNIPQKDKTLEIPVTLSKSTGVGCVASYTTSAGTVLSSEELYTDVTAKLYNEAGMEVLGEMMDDYCVEWHRGFHHPWNDTNPGNGIDDAQDRGENDFIIKRCPYNSSYSVLRVVRDMEHMDGGSADQGGEAYVNWEQVFTICFYKAKDVNGNNLSDPYTDGNRVAQCYVPITDTKDTLFFEQTFSRGAQGDILSPAASRDCAELHVALMRRDSATGASEKVNTNNGADNDVAGCSWHHVWYNNYSLDNSNNYSAIENLVNNTDVFVDTSQGDFRCGITKSAMQNRNLKSVGVDLWFG